MKNNSLLQLEAVEIKTDLINLILGEEKPDVTLIQKVNSMSADEILLAFLKNVNMKEATELTLISITRSMHQENVTPF